MGKCRTERTASPHISDRTESKQDYGTPREFLDAVEARFGRINFDLAALPHNAVAPFFYSPEVDSLKQDWRLEGMPGIAFLNPPFADIRPWAEKLDRECRWLPRWTVMLVPASMGSVWWADHVLGKCQADGITRMQFVGAEQGFPKDLALLCYGFGVAGNGMWQWKRWMKERAAR
jgi:phage N-6-adenine-methyltransferase